MDITFSCNKCGQKIAIDEAGAEQLVDCPKCGVPLEVPSKRHPVSVESAHERKCPDCAETIKADAKVCRFCGLDLRSGSRAAKSTHTDRQLEEIATAPRKTSSNTGVVAAFIVLVLIVVAFLIFRNVVNNSVPTAREVEAEAQRARQYLQDRAQRAREANEAAKRLEEAQRNQ